MDIARAGADGVFEQEINGLGNRRIFSYVGFSDILRVVVVSLNINNFIKLLVYIAAVVFQA
ncbi:hypothetical protein D3C87_1762880 [compost metagenome]